MITLEDVVTAAEAAVEDYGADWMDPNAVKVTGCKYTYVHEGKTRHCIAGWILIALGIDIAPEYNKETNVDEVIQYQNLDAERDVEVFLKTIQNQQDSGVPWGTALSIAKTRVGA